MREDHEVCSELLPGYATETLPPAERARVEGHLAVCERCRSELTAVAALQATEAGEALSDLERARLHRAVRDELFSVTTGAPKRPLAARLLPLMGAAAAVLALGFFISNADLGGLGEGDDAGEAASGAGGETRDKDHSGLLELGGPPIAQAPPMRAGTGDAAVSLEAEAGGESAGGSQTADTEETNAELAEAATDVPAEPPRPRFTRKGGTFTREDAARFGRSQEPFTAFARYYTPDDVSPLVGAYADALASAGETDRDRRTIQRCSEQVIAQSENVLPAFGAYGRLDGEAVLLLGFMYPTSASSPVLDRFMVWVWPRDDCEVPSAALSGKVD
ncbi:MAG: zf-HC2 domain-containing protein [Actinomycetota bacterium]